MGHTLPIEKIVPYALEYVMTEFLVTRPPQSCPSSSSGWHLGEGDELTQVKFLVQCVAQRKDSHHHGNRN